jgi:hypothetical protein
MCVCVCVCVCVYMCICIYICVCVCVHIYVNVCMCVYICIHVCVCGICIYVCMCVYTYIYIYPQGPLPESVGEFKEALTLLFPHIWDTKFLSVNSAGKYWDTTLGRLYETCVHDSTSAPIAVQAAEGFGKYQQDGSMCVPYKCVPYKCVPYICSLYMCSLYTYMFLIYVFLTD